MNIPNDLFSFILLINSNQPTLCNFLSLLLKLEVLYLIVPFVSLYGGGWVYLYSFICLSAGVLEWESSCFATTLLHHAPPKVTSVLVLFVIFGGLF